MSNKDYKGFQKVSADEHMTVFKHPSGHEVKVAHSALSAKMRKDLEKIPHMAAGGMTEEAPSLQNGQLVAAPAPQVPDAVYQSAIEKENALRRPEGMAQVAGAEAEALKAKAAQDWVASQQAQQVQGKLQAQQGLEDMNKARLEQGLPPMEAPAPQAAVPMQLAAPASNAPAPASVPATGQASGLQGAQGAGSDPYGAQVSSDQYMKGLGQEKQGIAQEAQALGAQEKAKAEVEGQKAQTLQNTMQTYEQNHAVLQKERDALQTDLQNSHIDPDRYVTGMSTGQKIRTALGLMLSGLGAGGSHQQSAAENFLKAQIDHDIESQKAEIGKKQNLLSMNMAKFQDLRSATDMTKAMQMDIAGAKLSQMAAQTNDPVIKARAMQAAGKLDRESAQIVGQMAARRTMLQGVANGSANPGVVIRSIVPEAHQAAAYKELAEAQQLNKARDNILGAFDKIAALNTAGNRIGSPLQTKRQIDAIVGPLTASLSKETAGRFTEQDFHILKDVWKSVGDDPNTVQSKRNSLNHLVSEKMNFPILDSYGIKPGNQSRFDQGGQKKIQMGPPKI